MQRFYGNTAAQSGNHNIVIIGKQLVVCCGIPFVDDESGKWKNACIMETALRAV
jgi:hypothetical protein